MHKPKAARFVACHVYVNCTHDFPPTTSSALGRPQPVPLLLTTISHLVQHRDARQQSTLQQPLHGLATRRSMRYLGLATASKGTQPSNSGIAS